MGLVGLWEVSLAFPIVGLFCGCCSRDTHSSHVDCGVLIGVVQVLGFRISVFFSWGISLQCFIGGGGGGYKRLFLGI